MRTNILSVLLSRVVVEPFLFFTVWKKELFRATVLLLSIENIKISHVYNQG